VASSSSWLPSLRLLAWLNVLVHGIALVLAVVGMAPGSGLVELPARLSYLAGRPLAWSVGWGAWMLCTLALVAFLAALTWAVPAGEARLALTLAVAAGAVDLFCDMIQMAALPLLAAQRPPPVPTFLAVERMAGAGGLVVANGGYTLAILLANLRLGRLVANERGRLRVVVLVGWGVVAGGSVLVLAGFLDSAVLAAVGTGPTIGLFCLWTVLAARAVEGRRMS
jgi:hypothetical protein